MSDFNFKPKVGMVTDNPYLHGAGGRDNLSGEGVIVFVGARDEYFVMENRYHDNTPVIINKSSYWVIEEEDFK